MKLPKPMNIILIGAIITILGGAITAYGTFFHNKASSKKTDSIKETGEQTNKNTLDLQTKNSKLIEEVDTLRTASKYQSKIISELTNQNAELSSKLSESTLSLHEVISGGDSYCSIFIANAGGGKFRLAAINKFKNSIPNVILTIENYSEIENCKIVSDNGTNRLNSRCVKANSVELAPMAFNTNINYFIGGDHFLVKSNSIRKLGVTMRTPNNTFYVQIIYRIISDNETWFLYRVLKKIDNKYIPIETNDDHNDKANPARWDSLFKLPPDMPTTDVDV